jgi:hypothetical protein
MGMDRTFVIKGVPESNWILVDAKEQGIGRLATQIAYFLLGKHKPTFTPGVEMGDFVVVVNAERLSVSNERQITKFYNSQPARPDEGSSGPRYSRRSVGHAAAQQAGPPVDQKVKDLYRERAPARGAKPDPGSVKERRKDVRSVL